MWEDYHSKLQILLIKKAIFWHPQILLHIDLVLHDGGIMDASGSEVEYTDPLALPCV